MSDHQQRLNEIAQAAFERERDRRAEYLAMDQRIRSIASDEVSKVIIFGMVIAAVYGAGREYGWPAGAAVVVAAFAVLWWNDRQKEKNPKFKIEDVDELAEDTVTQEHIVACERDGKPWLQIDGEDLNWDDFFDYPYWDHVNQRVRTYARMSHKRRVADNKVARQGSLPHRKAMLARLREHGEDWELPYWAHLDFDEREH